MTTFTPPTTTEQSDDPFFGRYQMTVGLSVVWNGSTFVTQPYPWLGEISDLVEGTTWFQGGRTYTVTPAVADALTTAGYAVDDFAMESWFTALRNRAASPAKVLVLGDSISEGVLTSTPAYQHRWIDLTQAQVRSRLGGPTATGYMPAYYADAIMTDDTTRGGGGTPTENSFIWGLGGKSLFIPCPSGVGGTLTWPAQTCSKIRIHYGKTNVSGGNFHVLIDGADVTSSGTLNTGAGAGSFVNCSNATKVDGFYWESADLSGGSHTVQVVSITSSSGAVINAAEFFNGDHANGVHLYDAAHSGARASDYIQASMDPSWQSVTAFAPQIALVNLGTNDSGSITAAQFETNMTTLVSKIQTASPSCVVVLVKGWRPGVKTQALWDQFRAALDNVANAGTNVTTFDLAAQWPALTTDGLNNQGLMVETTNPVHPNTSGHLKYAGIMTELLCPTGLAL